jgi:hypothetical protein
MSAAGNCGRRNRTDASPRHGVELLIPMVSPARAGEGRAVHGDEAIFARQRQIDMGFVAHEFREFDLRVRESLAGRAKPLTDSGRKPIRSALLIRK